MTLHMNRGRLRLLALSTMPMALALLAHLAALLLVSEHLPDPLASRFDVSGEPVSYLSRTGSILAGSALFALLAGTTAFTALRGKLTARGIRATLAWGWGLAGFLGYLLPVSTLVHRGVADAADARFPLWQIAVGAAVASATCAAGLLVARTVPVPAHASDDRTATGRIDLGRGEVASWSRRLTPGAAVVAAVALLGGSVACGALGYWAVALPLLAVGLPALWLSSAHVSVDRRGLTVAPALLSRPAVRIPLKSMEAVSNRDVNPVAEYGGWGYRVRHNRTGLIVRAGEAIVVRRTNGREFAVTVGDSATGAALLATLLDRRESR
ncbi:DUF1648 domain-containing protein [Streptomyces sp. CA-294286]|uniref:DUF1648 domain-containing protein n=1 Tax=Streptomyces sp. CA-294286 TaxID=3240070 RepID=UPI003D8ECBD5